MDKEFNRRDFLRFTALVAGSIVVPSCASGIPKTIDIQKTQDPSAVESEFSAVSSREPSPSATELYYPEIASLTPIQEDSIPINSSLINSIDYFNYTNLTVNTQELAELYRFTSTLAINPAEISFRSDTVDLLLDIRPRNIEKKTGQLYIVPSDFPNPGWISSYVSDSFAYTSETEAGVFTVIKIPNQDQLEDRGYFLPDYLHYSVPTEICQSTITVGFTGILEDKLRSRSYQEVYCNSFGVAYWAKQRMPYQQYKQLVEPASYKVGNSVVSYKTIIFPEEVYQQIPTLNPISP